MTSLLNVHTHTHTHTHTHSAPPKADTSSLTILQTYRQDDNVLMQPNSQFTGTTAGFSKQHVYKKTVWCTGMVYYTLSEVTCSVTGKINFYSVLTRFYFLNCTCIKVYLQATGTRSASVLYVWAYIVRVRHMPV